MPENERQKSKIQTTLQLGGVIVAVLAIIVTVYLSIRAERTKELTVTYLAKRPLVSIEGTRPSVGIEVRLGGNPIAAPWLVSAKLENTGNQPIEERDIEAPPKLSFPRAKIVGTEIVQRSQPAIFANASVKGSDITIDQKLLNPGDWVSFDIVFDGEPEIPASLTFRISGVTDARQRVVSLDEKKALPAIVPVPTPILYLMLTIGSLTGAGSLVAAIAFLGRSFRYVLPWAREIALDRFDPSRLAQLLSPYSREARMIHAAINEPISLALLDDPAALLKAIRGRVPPAVLDLLGLDATKAALMLEMDLKVNLREQLAGIIYHVLLKGPDKVVSSAFRKLDVSTVSADDLVKRAIDIVKEHTTGKGFFSRIDTDDLTWAIVFLVVGLSLTLLLAGTWRNVLAI